MAPEQHQQRETPDKAIVPSSQKSEDLFESEGFIMTSHQPVEKPQVSNGPDADMTWFETYKASRLYDDSKLSNAEKEFKLHWVQFIQDEPRHASSHKVLPVVLEYFIANNWKWIWQDGNRRQSFTNMVSGMRELGMLDISAAQHTIESYFEPPTTPYDTTRKTYYRVSLTKDDLKLFRRDLIAMWTSLRWLFVREYKESRTAWKRALQQFVLIARPMLLEEDVGVAITDTLEVLKVILDDPYYKVSKDIRAWDMKVQEVVQFINGRKIVASAAFKNDDKRDKLYKFVHCKRSREEQMASKKTQAEKRGLVDQLESGLDVHMIEYFGAYEGHWEWRRVREIDLLCCWLNADLTPDAVIKLLDKEASCGDTIGPTGGLMEYTPVNLTLRGEQKGTYDDEDEDESDENEA